MTTATALVLDSVNSPFSVEKVQLQPLQPHEILVRLKATGLCHTDIAVQQGKLPGRFPLVAGHEGAGVVEEVGSAVSKIQVGEHVLLSYNFCEQCTSCRRGKSFACVEMKERNFGYARQDGTSPMTWEDRELQGCFFGQSSFANPAVVQESSCVPINKSLPLELMAPLGCSIQTGAGTIFNILKPVENNIQSVAIFGIGAVGSAAIMGAKYFATQNPRVLTTIIAVDLNDRRLELAKSLGATHVINPLTTEDYVNWILKISGGTGVDAAVECTGVISVINNMILALGAGGRAVTVGAPPPLSTMNIEVFPFINGCKSYQGSNQGNSVSRMVRNLWKIFNPILTTHLWLVSSFPREAICGWAITDRIASKAIQSQRHK